MSYSRRFSYGRGRLNAAELQALSDEVNEEASRIADEACPPGNTGSIIKFDTPDGIKVRIGCELSDDDESSDDNLPINAMVERRRSNDPPPSSQEARRRARRPTSSKSKRVKKRAKTRIVPDP